MTLAEFNTYCQSFRGAETVVQWGGAHVWKVGGKVFAIGGWAEGEDLAVTFKVDLLTYDQLQSSAGCRPAPYLASRGMTWIQWTSPASVSSEDLRTYIAESYELVASKLTKAMQRRIGEME
ncbi:MAG: MmcQ/YjbR family DNA-binding protein [Fimbriiglobus sp.]